jgi:pimeloyl-ACP methyl ester carboxylesterase
MLRYLLCLLGVSLSLPLLGLIALAFTLPVTISGVGYLLASTLMVTGFIVAPWQSRYSALLVCAGVVGLVLVAGARLALVAGGQDANLRVVTLPQGRGARWISYLIDEQDSLIFGEAIFHRLGGDTAAEHEQITAAFQTAYSDIRKAHRIFASPFLGTYLNLQRPAAFEVVRIQPETLRHPNSAVIFLHGYMGNVTAQCWEIAQAVGAFGTVTACPSTDWTGQWWTAAGEAIVRATFRDLRAQGFETFYVGGFSNGGFGLSRLAIKLAKEAGVRGLFFINGVSNAANIRETGLPILVIQAAQDARVPAEGTRQIAGSLREQATYVELEGDHFIIMKQPKPVQEAISAWLESQALTQ